MTKRALITGITGQDGAYLAKFLLGKGYQVFGTFRRSSTPNVWRLTAQDVYQKVKLIPADVTDMSSLLEAVTVSQADEVYNLAAQSFVGASFEKPLLTGDVDALGATRLLEVLRVLRPKARFYQASSSEIYGNVSQKDLPINEATYKGPASPYAAAKLYSYHITKIYRNGYGMFATNGILFNHESPMRGLEFVTRKITNSAAQIKLGLREKVTLGNLEARRDWGYAPEYVEAMWMILQADKPEDFVIATGESHSVREVLDVAFGTLGLKWEDYTQTDRGHLRPLDVQDLVGDASKARDRLGWKPKTSFKELITHMVKVDYDRWQRYLKGEVFPWDAPNYPDEASIIGRVLRQ